MNVKESVFCFCSQKKWQKVTYGGEGAARKVVPLTPNFSIPIFFSTQFSILCIPWGPDNIAVNTNKNNQEASCTTGYTIYGYDMYLCVKVNVQID